MKLMIFLGPASDIPQFMRPVIVNMFSTPGLTTVVFFQVKVFLVLGRHSVRSK